MDSLTTFNWYFEYLRLYWSTPLAIPNSGVQRSSDARGDCLIGCPPYQILVLSSGVGPWWSLLLNMRCLWRHDMTSYSRLETNVLATFVDTCIFSDAGAEKDLGQWKLTKNKKSRYQLCLFLFINNVDLKNNDRNCRKLFWIIWIPE